MSVSMAYMSDNELLDNFHSLAKFFKQHINDVDSHSWIVFDAICAYSREYKKRHGVPILCFVESSILNKALIAEGL